MRILLTGATGYIGSALAAELMDSGHYVTGLARHPDKAKPLCARGLHFRFTKGDLTQTPLLTELASNHDAIIHAGSVTGPEAGQVDARAVDALLAGAKAGRTQIFLYTSGVWVLGETGDAGVDESSPTRPFATVVHRPVVERRVLEAGGGALRTNVVRPGIVYGGKEGILAMWWASALREKHVRVVGDGHNRWSLVHREDLARLYALILERGAPGGLYHGTDDTAHRTLDLARAVARVAGADVQPWSQEEARAQLGLFADALALDQVVRSPAARALGWAPQHHDFLREADSVYREFIASPRVP